MAPATLMRPRYTHFSRSWRWKGDREPGLESLRDLPLTFGNRFICFLFNGQ